MARLFTQAIPFVSGDRLTLESLNQLNALVDGLGGVDGALEIAASQVSSGTFADARIAESNVTQHQGALTLTATQVQDAGPNFPTTSITSGVFANARIAESNVTQHEAALTLTGGLPYFGGAGNNYSMHALAEAVSQLRDGRGTCALVTSVGGILSKHAAGIYSCEPSTLNWAEADTRLSRDSMPARSIVESPTAGSIVSYVVNYRGGDPAQVVVLAEAGEGTRFVANSVESSTLDAMAASVQAGQPIRVVPAENGALHFSLA